MEPVKKIIITLVIFTTANLINAADAQNLDYQLLLAIGDNAEIQAITDLLERGANSDAADDHGETALHYATRKNNIEVVKLLLDRGANVNAANRFKLTPLMHAAAKGYTGIIELLLARGADVNLKDRHGRTAMDIEKDFGKSAIATILQDLEDIPVTKGVMEEDLWNQ